MVDGSRSLRSADRGPDQGPTLVVDLGPGPSLEAGPAIDPANATVVAIVIVGPSPETVSPEVLLAPGLAVGPSLDPGLVPDPTTEPTEPTTDEDEQQQFTTEIFVAASHPPHTSIFFHRIQLGSILVRVILAENKAFFS